MHSTSQSSLPNQLKKTVGLIPITNQITETSQHPLSPLPPDQHPSSNTFIPSSTGLQSNLLAHQTKSYFDLKADSDQLISSQTPLAQISQFDQLPRPPTPSSSTLPTSQSDTTLQNPSSNSTHASKQLEPPETDVETDVSKRIVEPGRHLQTNTSCLPTRSAHNLNNNAQETCAINPDQGPTKRRKSKTSVVRKGKSPERVRITLSDEPHRLKSNRQLLRELKTTIIKSAPHPSSSRPTSPSSSSNTLDNRVMSDLMLTIIRELSSRLEQTKHELANSQLDTKALKSLLVDSYSVGLGEIERCLVRSKFDAFPHPSSDQDSVKSPPTTSPWTLELTDHRGRHRERESEQDYASTPSTRDATGLSSNLDLEDLREAMFDNPSYDTASLSSCPSQSLINSPTSFAGQLNVSNRSSRSQEQPSKAGMIGSRLFKPGFGRVPKPVTSTPTLPSGGSLLPPHSIIDNGTFQKKLSQPNDPIKGQTKRKDSIGSSLSGVSSQCNHSGASAGGSWGFHGWRWSNKTQGNTSKVASTCGTDADDDDESEIDIKRRRQTRPVEDSSQEGNDKLKVTGMSEGKRGAKGKRRLPHHSDGRYIEEQDLTNLSSHQGQLGSGSLAPTVGHGLLANFFETVTRRRSASSNRAVEDPHAHDSRQYDLTGSADKDILSSESNIPISSLTDIAKPLCPGPSSSGTQSFNSLPVQPISPTQLSRELQQADPSQSSSSSHYAQAATPTSTNTDFLSNGGNNNPSNRSSCGSVLSSSINSFSLPAVPFLSDPHVPQSGEMVERLAPSRSASDVSSLAVSRVLSEIPAPPPTVNTAGAVPAFVLETASPAAALLLSPSSHASRRTSLTAVKSPICHIFPTSKCPPTLSTQADSFLPSEPPFSHASPPRIHQSRDLTYAASAASFSPLLPSDRHRSRTSSSNPLSCAAEMGQSDGAIYDVYSVSESRSSSVLLDVSLPKTTTGSISSLSLQEPTQSDCGHRSMESDEPEVVDKGEIVTTVKLVPQSGSLASDDVTGIEGPEIDSKPLLSRFPSAIHLPTHSARPGTPAKKSQPQSKLTAHVMTKGYLSTAKATLDAESSGTSNTSSKASAIDPLKPFPPPNVTTFSTAALSHLASTSTRLSSQNSVLNLHRAAQQSSSTSPGMVDQLQHDTNSKIAHQPSTNPRAIDKLGHIVLPTTSNTNNSTMELSTFLSAKSNPPPFSAFNRQALSPLWKGVDDNDEQPITDRFGFVVDAKYGMRLMRESRNKKKRHVKKTSITDVVGEESLINNLKDAQQPLPIKIDVESSSTAMAGAEVSSEGTVNPEPATDKVGECDEADLQGESEDQEPIVTTALPIKSQNDVEAELASLRESLGLPPAASKSNPGNSSERVNHLFIESSGSSKKESPNESIKRLLSQLNQMQEALERNQLIEWNEFISKRKARSIKTLMSVSHHHHSSASITTGPPGEVSSMLRAATGVKGTSDPVSPESVGAFLGFRESSETTATATVGVKSHSVGSSVNTHNASSMNGLANEATRKVSERDLMICHDENLIGIASMGLSQDHKSVKEDWKELRGLVTKGVPISLRPKIWLECSGANEMKEPGYYYDLLDCHKDKKGMALNQIECDVTRTLPTNVYFGGDGPGVEKLRRVLAAMSWHNPVVGYCQGMNMVAATLLLTIPNEEDAFWILVCIVDKILPSEYYTSHLLSSQADQRVLKDLVEKYLPELWEHFEGMEVELAAIAFGWFLSLFADALPIQTLLRVFDLFLIDGSLILFRVAMALLKMHQEEILSHDSPASLYAYMRGRMTLSTHHADRLIRVAVEEFGEVKNKEITRLREKYVTELKKEMGLDEVQ